METVQPYMPQASMTGLLRASISPEGVQYRDLNANGVMDPYEDPRRPVTERVRDLMARMTPEEKVGQLFQRQAEVGPDGGLVEKGAIFLAQGTSHLIQHQHITHVFALLQPKDASLIARWHNRLQKAAEATRLGIPVTLSTDPVHADVHNLATGVRSPAYSEWPEAIGLAALRDPEVVREFAEIARREYVAVGIRSALHPQIDLATEPRWSRQSGTFGPDAELTGAYSRAYIEGFQKTSAAGQALSEDSVACMAKHFPGGGPQLDGEDPHFPYGREQVYPSDLFEYHLRPFVEAIEVGVSAIMPYYSLPMGLERHGRKIEPVGFAFNKQIITGILREELGFDGVVCSDFGIISPYETSNGTIISPARAWGVEHLDRKERVAKALDAGCDQFGGESCTELLLALLAEGTITEARIDESVARLLRVKFELGLFDDPYVDEEDTPNRVGDEAAMSSGYRAQISTLTLLENRGSVLPITANTRVYVVGAAGSAFADRVQVVETAEEADVAVVRLPAPFEPRNEFILERVFHAGSLEFPDETVAHLRNMANAVPLIIDVRLDRPAILTPLVDVATVLIGSYGSSDSALARALTDPAAMQGRLPFDIPRTMTAVEHGRPDAPYDLDDVLYLHGFHKEFDAR